MHSWHVPREMVARYATRAPRYTSYPPVPVWKSPADLEALVAEEARPGRDISLYLHIPFCEELCWFCACNKVITRNPEHTTRYISALKVEIDQWARRLGDRRVVQVHWGGGTPTHLSPEQIGEVYRLLTGPFRVAEGAEISIEVHPAVTTTEHLDALRECGFNRISMGIQDFDPVVQKAIHRMQGAEQTLALAAGARQRGFESVNVDLVYGLPLQSHAGFSATLDQVAVLDPDRVALFHYAHVPGASPAQKLIKEDQLPDSSTKLDLFEMAVDRFAQRGMRLIGMDHFAKPGDELSGALDEGTLRRNFMGYTTCGASDVIGVGMSSISDLDGAFVQNQRELKGWTACMDEGRSALVRGHRLDAEDKLRREVIMALACQLRLDKAAVARRWNLDFDQHFAAEVADLRGLEADGLVELAGDTVRVLPRGQVLLRNVCSTFDASYRAIPPEQRTGSRTL